MCDFKQLDKKWRETMDKSISNKEWDTYDATVKDIIAGYNSRLHITVDWKLIKAMLWVESTGPEGLGGAWKKAVMQIGNKGDPGWSVVKAGLSGNTEKSEGSELILTDSDKLFFKASSIDVPAVNIRATVVYLLARMARTSYLDEIDEKDKTEYTYVVKKDDTYSSLQKPLGTTVKVLEDMNGKKPLRIGQTLKYRKAKVLRKIVSWRTFDTSTIAARYNGGGDALYSCKLDYALDLFKKLEPATRR